MCTVWCIRINRVKRPFWAVDFDLGLPRGCKYGKIRIDREDHPMCLCTTQWGPWNLLTVQTGAGLRVFWSIAIMYDKALEWWLLKSSDCVFDQDLAMLLPYLQKGDKASFKHGLGVMATWLQLFLLGNITRLRTQESKQMLRRYLGIAWAFIIAAMTT